LLDVLCWFVVLSLQLSLSTNINDDAYFKDFIDIIDSDPKVAEELGIIMVNFGPRFFEMQITQDPNFWL
jgi:hypothetical protein